MLVRVSPITHHQNQKRRFARAALIVAGYCGAAAGFSLAYFLGVTVSAHWFVSRLYLAVIVLGSAAAAMLGHSFVTRKAPAQESRLAVVPLCCLVPLAVLPLAHLAGNGWLVSQAHDAEGAFQLTWKLKTALGGVALAVLIAVGFVRTRWPGWLSNGLRRYSGFLLLVVFLGVHAGAAAILVWLPVRPLEQLRVHNFQGLPAGRPMSKALNSSKAEFGCRGTWSRITDHPFVTTSWTVRGNGFVEFPINSHATQLSWAASQPLADRLPPGLAPYAENQRPCRAVFQVSFDGNPAAELSSKLGTVEKSFSTPIRDGAGRVRLTVRSSADCRVQVYNIRQLPAFTGRPARCVILISLDSVAEDHTSFGQPSDIETSPAMTRLVKEDPLAFGFTSAVASSNWTLPSHATAWTGLYPSQHGLIHNHPVTPFSDEVKTLGEIAARQGMTTIGLVSHLRVDARYGYARGMDYFARYDQGLGTRGREVLDDALSLLEHYRGQDLFMFIHLFDAHFPYTNYPHDYQQLVKGIEPQNPVALVHSEIYKKEMLRGGGRDPRQRARNKEKYGPMFLPAMPSAKVAYQLGIRDLDDMLGRFFEELRCRDQLDGISMVIFADHGEVVRGFHRGLPDYASNTLTRTFPRGLDTEIVSREVLELAAEEATDRADREHVTYYVWRQPERFRLLSVANDLDESRHRWTVDTAEDLQFIRRIYREFGNAPFSYQDTLDVLAAHPEWVGINSHVEQKKL